jgi:hypothetical protein
MKLTKKQMLIRKAPATVLNHTSATDEGISYQPGWTLVGAGVFTRRQTERRGGLHHCYVRV